MDETRVCTICGGTLRDDENCTVDGEWICEDCAENETTVCDHCGERIWVNDAVADDHMNLCQCCYDDHYHRCEGCGRLIHENDAVWHNDYPYCSYCYDRIEVDIEEYGYKPDPVFYGEGSRYFGVELEVDDAGKDDENARKIKEEANVHDEHIYIKSDGSLDDGFEIVTHPMTLDYHLHQMYWEDVLTEAIRLGYKSHMTSTCGLHIHVNRSAFGDNEYEQEKVIERILFFIELHWNEMFTFSRRSPHNINRWAARYGMEKSGKEILDKAKKGNLGRYAAVNLCPYQTIEFRLFRGTGGIPPLGYDLDEQRHLVVNEHEAEAVRAIFEMFAAGHGYSEIISWLNDHGYTTKRGTMFVKNGLFSILCNEKYIGTYVYNRAVPRKFKSAIYKGKWKPAEEIVKVPGGCPAIISQELFDKVQAIKAANKRRSGRYYSKEFYLLTGIVFCGICGRRYQGNIRLSGKSKCRFATYRCETHRAKCGNKEMNKNYLDAYIISLLKDKLFNSRAMHTCINRLNRYISQYNSTFDTQYESKKSRLDELSQSLANITAAIEKGMLTDAMIQRAEELEAERNGLLIDVDGMHRLNPVSFEQYSYLIDEFRRLPRSTGEFREFVQTYVQKITVFPYRTEITLHMGFDVTDDLTETVAIRRGDLYAMFERKGNYDV